MILGLVACGGVVNVADTTGGSNTTSSSSSSGGMCVADDGNECTMDQCENGAAVHAPEAAGTPCNQGICDGASQCVPACANYEFKSGVVVPGLGDGGYYLARAVDIAPITGVPEAVSVWVGNNPELVVAVPNGDGTYHSVITALTVKPGFLSFADFNHDGKLDAALVADQAWNGSGLALMLGDGTGAFHQAAVMTFDGQDSARGVVNADFNGDGELDLAIATYAGIALLLGRGDGTFAPSKLVVMDADEAIAAADFDGDGHIDLVSGGNANATTQLHHNNGDGTFTSKNIGLANDPAMDALPVDLNHDGAIDLAVLTGAGVRAWLNDGHGMFAQAWKHDADYGVSAHSKISAADLNGDGKLDLVVSASLDYPSVTASVFQGAGDGTFSAPRKLDVPGIVFPALKDMNGDGRPDLAGIYFDPSTNAASLAVRFNTCAP